MTRASAPAARSRFRLGGAGTTFSDLALDGAGRIYLTGGRATTPRHQLFVARLTTAGALDPAYGAARGYAVANLNGASAAVYEVEAAACASTPTAPRSPSPPSRARPAPPRTWSASPGSPRRACWTRRSAPPARARRTSRPRTSSTRPRLVTLPDGGFVVGGAHGRRLHHAVRRSPATTRTAAPDTTLNPANTTAANAANLQVGTGGVDRIVALALTPQGRLLAAGASQTPSEQNLSAIVRLGGDAHAPQAAVAVTWEQAVPGRAVRPGQTVGFDASASTDPDGPIAKYEWDIDGDGDVRAHRRQGARQLPGPTIAGVTPARHRRRRADAHLRRDGHRRRPTRRRPSPSSTRASSRSRASRSSSARRPPTPTAASSSYAFDFDGNGTYETAAERARRWRPRRSCRRARRPSASASPTTRARRPRPRSTLTVKDAPCVDNPTIKIERAVIITQGADVAGGAGCFHGVTSDKAGVRTTVCTTTGHFRVNGLEVDTLAASEATLEWKRKQTGDKETISLKLIGQGASVEGTAKKTDFMFHEGSISWDLSGTTIAGFVVDPNAGVGGLALKVLGPPTLKADGSSTLDVLPGMPPELLGKTPSAPDHLVFGPSANASALGAFSFHVDQIPLGVILLGPVTVTYDGAGSWLIEAEATIPYPIPTKVAGRLVIVAGHVKEVDLELQGALPTPTPVVINALGLHIDFGPKVAAKQECIKTVGLVETTPYDTYKALDYYIPVLRQLGDRAPGALRQPVPQDVPALPDADVRALRAHRAEPRRGASTPTSASASPATTTRTRTSSSSTARRRSPRSSRPRSTPSSRPRATSTSTPRSRAATRRRTRGSTGTSGWTSSTSRSSSTPRRTPCSRSCRWTSRPARTCSSPTRASPPACTSRRSAARGGRAPARCGATARRCTCSAATSRTTRSSSSTRSPATR